MLLRLGFDELGLHRLWGARAPGNTVSDRLLEGWVRIHVIVGDDLGDWLEVTGARWAWPQLKPSSASTEPATSGYALMG